MTSLYSNDPAIKQAQIDQDVADINNEIEYLGDRGQVLHGACK